MADTGWKDVKHLAKENDIEYMQWYTRAIREGWDAVRAATTPIEEQKKEYMIDGIVATTKEHCDRKGLILSTVRSRMLDHGMSFELALKYKTDTSKSRKQKRKSV